MTILELQLGATTAPAWIKAVLDDFSSFLQDHASCEKKASGMALSISAHYPDKPAIVSAMAELAVEELSHYREVIRLLSERNIPPSPDVKDVYVNALNKLIRRGSATFLMDRLLIAAIVEKRGHERFSILADALHGDPTERFYQAIVASEKRHYLLFLELAAMYCDVDVLSHRLDELIVHERDILLALPVRAALH